MTFEEFIQSVSNSQPPKTTPLLQSLWYDKKGDWNKSHDIAQDIHTPDGSWVHAYLHRKEEDIWNADYWYRRAGRTRPSVSLDKEWESIVKAFL